MQPLASAVAVAPLSEEPRRPGEPQMARSWLDRLTDPMRWEPVHQRLAAQALFASCSRADIRLLARAGDECFVPAGTVLCRAGRIGYWLFVVTSGVVEIRDAAGGTATTLGAGAHFGHVAIVGFGPQPVTAEVVEDATVFVLGRRSVLGLVYSMPGLRAGLFPGVSEVGLRTVFRELREAGMAAWKAMPRKAVDELLAGDAVEQLPPAMAALPSRRREGGAGERSLFPFALVPGAGATPAPVAVAVRPVDRRVVGGMVAAIVSAVAIFACSFHPDVVVVRPSRPIDVSADVVIAEPPGGGKVSALHAPRGRYILTAVDIEETTLAGLALAKVQGHDTLPRARGEAAAQDERSGRDRYRESQRVALDVVARRAGLDPAALPVRFRDRGLVGPSAGLVYALVLADMADVVSVPRGRVIAATGELAPDGTIRTVGFLAAKREVARGSGATIFFTPGARGSRGAPGTVSVANLDEALAAIVSA